MGEYDVIYADPPWRHDFYQSKSRRTDNHYPTMDTPSIMALDVPAARDAVLFLWATAPKLLEALDVMAAWGFRYRTHAAWDKVHIGLGWWFRGQHELLLVGTRGTFHPPPHGLRHGSVYREPRTRHSAKPTVIRDDIVRWFPNAHRLELFARDIAPGWDAWGNEVSATVDISS